MTHTTPCPRAALPRHHRIGLKQVIPAWDEGVLTMQVGETVRPLLRGGSPTARSQRFNHPSSPPQARITATQEVAYGAAGFPAWGIPPNATLLFDIELLKVE
jgi:peptidylprolyl isomerase